MAYRKVCEQLGIKVSASENGRRNLLKRMNICNTTQQQKEDAEKKAIEEHHAILFILGADKYRNRKLIGNNDIARKNDPFPKTVTEAWHVLSKWKNHYSGKYNNNKTESNDDIAFTTVMRKKKQ